MKQEKHSVKEKKRFPVLDREIQNKNKWHLNAFNDPTLSQQQQTKRSSRAKAVIYSKHELGNVAE